MPAATGKRRQSTAAGTPKQQTPVSDGAVAESIATERQQEPILLSPPASQQPGAKRRKLLSGQQQQELEGQHQQQEEHQQLSEQEQGLQQEEQQGTQAAEVGSARVAHASTNHEQLQQAEVEAAQIDAEDTELGDTEPGTDMATDELPSSEPEAGKKRKQGKVLTEEKLKRIKEEYDKRGVVYVSRMPPHMKPMKLKQLLSQYGQTLRVYCTPEDHQKRKERKKSGGNTGKNFTEGWVEFADKRIAKRVAVMLNGQRIGGKRRSAYYDDLWCIKYLKHFKWDHLTEEIAYQKAIREQRLATEISAAKRERDHYLAQVDKAKGLAAMAERRAAKAAQQGVDGDQAAVGQAPAAQPELGGAAGAPAKFMNRDIGQRAPRADPAQGATTGRELAEDVLMLVARKKKKPTSQQDA